MDKKKLALLGALSGGAVALYVYKASKAGAVTPPSGGKQQPSQPPSGGGQQPSKGGQKKPSQPTKKYVKNGVNTVIIIPSTHYSNAGDQVNVEVQFNMVKTVAPDEYSNCYLTIAVRDPSGKVRLSKTATVKVSGGNYGDYRFTVTPDAPGKWTITVVGKGDDGKAVTATDYLFVSKAPFQPTNVLVKYVKLTPLKTEVMQGDKIWLKIAIATSGIPPGATVKIHVEMYAAIEGRTDFKKVWQLDVPFNGVNYKELKVWLPTGYAGTYKIYVYAYNPGRTTSITPSNTVTIKVKALDFSNGITKVITKFKNTVKFTLSGGEWLLVCERDGDPYPRWVDVWEDLNGRTKKLLHDLIVEVSPPYRKLITVDHGVHDVYVHITCGVGAWKVIMVPHNVKDTF